eukprot:gene14928-biopygen20151
MFCACIDDGGRPVVPGAGAAALAGPHQTKKKTRNVPWRTGFQDKEFIFWDSGRPSTSFPRVGAAGTSGSVGPQTGSDSGTKTVPAVGLAVALGASPRSSTPCSVLQLRPSLSRTSHSLTDTAYRQVLRCSSPTCPLHPFGQ